MAKAYVSRAADKKAVRLDLSEQDHADLRRMAADAGLQMSQMANRVVTEAIAKWRKKSGKSEK